MLKILKRVQLALVLSFVLSYVYHRLKFPEKVMVKFDLWELSKIFSWARIEGTNNLISVRSIRNHRSYCGDRAVNVDPSNSCYGNFVMNFLSHR